MPTHGLQSRIVKKWLSRAARIFGVRIKYYGSPLPQRTLFVANHISWLDILVLGSLVPIHFLSKHEVKTMPVFGWLATRAGTLYIKRGNKRSATESSCEITAALNQQHNSLIFAEGTTTDGHIKKFHSRMMQSAIDAHAMVQPIAIFYPIKNPETGKIEIRVTRDAQAPQLLIDVIDNGIGVPGDRSDEIFEPFVTTRNVGGTDLGLPTAARIVKAHGGELSLLRSQPGETIFRVALPVSRSGDVSEDQIEAGSSEGLSLAG